MSDPVGAHTNDRNFNDYVVAQAEGKFRGTFYDWKALDENDRKAIMEGRMISNLGMSIPPNIYSHDTWSKMIEEMFEEVRHLAKAKGGEYSGDIDRLLNFRRNGIALDLPMETVWAVYAGKHWDAIQQYIKDLRTGKKRERMESIDGRIKDLIVYLLLLQAMVDERGNDSTNE